MRSQKWRMAVFYYIFYAQTRLEGKNFILLHPSKHWRLAAFTFYQGKSYWRAGDLDQGINLEWPYDIVVHQNYLALSCLSPQSGQLVNDIISTH